MQTADGRLYVIGGASRSGKTAWTVRHTEKLGRVIAWDVEDQWSKLKGWKRVTRRTELIAECCKPGKYRIAYVPAGDLSAEFDFWAGSVMYAGRFIGPVACIAEELADVTNPSKATGKWGILLRRGLKRGITIYALSQRWSEADKTAIGNASDFVLFRLSSADDVRYLSRKTRVPESELNGLAPLEFVKFDALTGGIERGKLKF